MTPRLQRAQDPLFLRHPRALLLGWLLLTLLCLAVTFSPLRSGYAGAPDRGSGDVQLYRAEVDRIAAGESYYSAAGDELRARGYPTKSVFNWRTPLPMWLVAQLPHRQAGRALSGGLALLALALGFALLQRQGSLRQALCGTLWMTGALLPCVLEDIFIMPDVWAGLFLALSIGSFGAGRSGWGVACGIAALFLRDLAGPYCLLMLAWSLAHRRRSEAVGWLAGLALYAGYFAWHATTVQALMRPDDLAHAGSWIQLGGLPFLIATAQMNCYLLLLPQWVTAVYLPLALVGLCGWRGEAGQRLGMTISLYLALLAAVGHPFNQYWGQLFAPLLCLAVAQSPAVLCEACRRAHLRQNLLTMRIGPAVHRAAG